MMSYLWNLFLQSHNNFIQKKEKKEGSEIERLILYCFYQTKVIEILINKTQPKP